MQVTINGRKEVLDNGSSYLSINDLLSVKDVEMPDMVAVELNGTILEREDFKKTYLSEGDNVEFLYFMGGGGSL